MAEGLAKRKEMSDSEEPSVTPVAVSCDDLTEEERNFLRELDTELSDRYTENDPNFMAVHAGTGKIEPPVLKVQNMERRFNNDQNFRGRGNRNNYRNNNNNNYNNNSYQRNNNNYNHTYRNSGHNHRNNNDGYGNDNRNYNNGYNNDNRHDNSGNRGTNGYNSPNQQRDNRNQRYQPY